MSLQQNVTRLGRIALVVIVSFLLLRLVHWADAAYATQRRAAESAPAPAAAAWTQVYYFEHAAVPKAVLGDGWSIPEPQAGVWSSHRRAALRLPPASLAGPVEVALTVDAFIAPARPFQRVTARAGDRTLGEWRLKKAETTTLRFAVPAELRGGALELQLELPDAESPARVLGVTDARLLGIKLRRIDVTG